MAHSIKSLGDILDRYRPELQPFEEIYERIHQKPELPGQESHTASTVAHHLKKLGYRVHEKIGGHGLVGVLENGQGTKVLLRAELDALPVEEKTGLPYASRARMKDDDGEEKPVMHACGHDMHMACLLAAAALLASARDHWRGMVLALFQPNEERAGGARAMVEAGLYAAIPRPDVLLAQHVLPHRAGNVSIGRGAILTAASTVHVRVFGRGGHGSAPQNAVDPIATAAYVLVRLQALVSRETDPQEPAVVTCGCIRGGAVANVIPDHCDLHLNVRTYSEKLHEEILDGIKRIVKAECEAARAPREAQIEVTDRYPPTVNDGKLVDAVSASFGSYFGKSFVDEPRATASEDFSVLADAIGAPYAYWSFGGTLAKKYDEALKMGTLSQLPGNHSAYFAPDVATSLRTGTDAAALAALTFLGDGSA